MKIAAMNWDTLIGASAPNFRGATVADLFSGGGTGSPGLISLILFFAGGAFVIYFILGGLSWMMSKGDPKAVGAARARITMALLGFAIVFSAYWIVQLLGLIFNVGGVQSVFGR
jgi:hypothetical protein